MMKTLIITLLLVASITSGQARPDIDLKLKIDRQVQLHGLLQIMDVATTTYLVNNGGIELNPIIKPIAENVFLLSATKYLVYRLDDKLTTHFSYGEMIASQTAVRHGIDNSPSPVEIENFIELCQNVLEFVRAHYKSPVFITSGYRCQQLNDIIGGSLNSQHMDGRAADFYVSGKTPFELWQWIVTKSNLNIDQVIAEFVDKNGNGWVHCSYRNVTNNRNKVTIARRINNQTIYTHYTKEQIIAGDYEL